MPYTTPEADSRRQDHANYRTFLKSEIRKCLAIALQDDALTHTHTPGFCSVFIDMSTALVNACVPLVGFLALRTNSIAKLRIAGAALTLLAESLANDGKNVPHGNLVHTTPGLGFPIQLYQESATRYRVTYGSQSANGLDFSTASRMYGQFIFHALQSEGKFEASER